MTAQQPLTSVCITTSHAKQQQALGAYAVTKAWGHRLIYAPITVPTCVSSVAATGDCASGQEDEQCGEEVLCKECLQGDTLLIARTGYMDWRA